MTFTGAGLSLDASSCSMSDAAISERSRVRLAAEQEWQALGQRAGKPVAFRLGQMLLAFAGGPIGKDEAAVAG